MIKDQGSFEDFETFEEFVNSRAYLNPREITRILEHEKDHARTLKGKGYACSYSLRYSTLLTLGRLEILPMISARVYLKPDQIVPLDHIVRATLSPERELSFPDRLNLALCFLYKCCGVKRIKTGDGEKARLIWS